MKFTGKVWRYGDNIDTDVIIPARYLNTSNPQELARHSTPTITMNVYVRTKEERVRGVIEALGETVRAAPASQLNPNGISGQETEMHKAL